MGSMLRICAVLASVVAAAASATAPGKHAVTTTASISAPYEATWSAVIDVFAEYNWTIQNVDKGSGLITTDWMTLDKKHADCGTAPLLTSDQLLVRFNIRVKERDSTSTVAVNASFRQARTFEGRTNFVDCSSVGSIESRIHDLVEQWASSNDRIATKKRERAKKDEAVTAPLFHCTSAPADANIASCARSAAGCAKRQADIVALVGDATPCVEQQGAICFKGISGNSIIESCHPTAATCDKQLDKAAGDAVMTDLSSCAAP